MRPERFEEHIKEQLGRRKIKPSAGGWERLEKQLDASQEKQSRKNYAIWFAVAGFAGILILAGSFFAGIENKPTTIVVEQSGPVKSESADPAQLQSQEQVAENSRDAEDLKKEKQKTTPAPIKKSNSFQREDVAVAASDRESEKKSITEEDRNLDKTINREVEALLTEVSVMESQGPMVTDEEIEKLLRRAQRDIISGSVLSQDSRTVDASYLLMEVENELDPSFRERVFETLKEKFIKARAAFAARN